MSLRRKCVSFVEHGFSLVELLFAVAILFVIAAIAIPAIMNGMDLVRLRGAGGDYSGILQLARTSAVEQTRFYSVLTTNLGPDLIAYVDTLPQNANGTSGNGAYDAGEPLVVLGAGVVVDNVNAPAQANLQSQVVPPASGVALTATTPSAVTFSARGLPCAPAGPPGNTTCFARSATPVAYATYFKSPIIMGSGRR